MTMTKHDKTKFYTVNQIADMFGVGKNTVRMWGEKEELPAVKVGKQWFFHKSAVSHKQSVDDALRVLGEKAYVSSSQLFDILLDNTRIEVKSSTERKGKKGSTWMFTNFHPSEHSDFYLLLFYNETRTALVKIAYIPSTRLEALMEIIGSKSGNNFSLNQKELENLLGVYLLEGMTMEEDRAEKLKRAEKNEPGVSESLSEEDAEEMLKPGDPSKYTGGVDEVGTESFVKD